MRADSGASLSCVKTSARLRRGVDQRDLVLRVDRRDGDAIDPLGQQVVDDPLLFCGGAIRGEAELGFDIRQLLVGLLDAAPGNRPEVGGVVGDEGDLERPPAALIAAPREPHPATTHAQARIQTASRSTRR